MRSTRKIVGAAARQMAKASDVRGRLPASGPDKRLVIVGSTPAARGKQANALARQRGTVVKRVSLDALVSRHRGETERNLNRLLAEAEQAGAVLFFDEADALFGKRTTVKDSHDRYANLEVSGLLQRIEHSPATVILGFGGKSEATLAPKTLRHWRRVPPVK